MSTRRKFKQIKRIINHNRLSLKQRQLHVAFQPLLTGMSILRKMSSDDIKKISHDEGNGIISISLESIAEFNKQKY